MPTGLVCVRRPRRRSQRGTTAVADAGAGTQIFNPPPHLSDAYADHGTSRGELPVAEALAQTNLAMPLHPHLRDDEQGYVIDALHAILGLPGGKAATSAACRTLSTDALRRWLRQPADS